MSNLSTQTFIDQSSNLEEWRVNLLDNLSAVDQSLQMFGGNLSTEARTTTPLEVASTVISILAIIVNLCVLLVIYIGPRAFRTPTFFFISSLATADLLTGVTILLAVYLPVRDQSWERLLLKGMSVVCFSASVNNLLVIAGDRYLKINDDRRYGKVFTNRSAAVLILFTWLMASCTFLVAPLAGWACGDCVCPRDAMCTCDPVHCSQSFTPFTKSYLVVGVAYFGVTLSVMVGLYSALFASVRRRAGSKQRGNGSVMGPVASRGPFVMIHRRREIRLAKTLVIVMGVFFVCWLPVVTLFVYDITVDDKRLIAWFDYCLASAVVHPLANPIIYSLRLPRMWGTFKYLSYALWRRLVMKSSPPRHHAGKLYRSANSSVRRQGSGAASIASQHSIRFRVDQKRRRQNMSVATQVSTLPPDRTSSDGSDVFMNNSDPRSGGKGVQRSVSARILTKREDVKSPRSSDDTLCSTDSGCAWDCKKRRRTTSRSVLLADGSVVPRDSVTISPPLHPQYKVAWN